MRKSSVTFILMWALTGVFLWAQAQKAPDTIVFKSKMGDVTYTHKKHADTAAKGDCKVCHDKLFPQSKAPINFKAAMHRTAEAAKSSCAACHVAGGTAFASKGNCQKCHQKGGGKG